MKQTNAELAARLTIDAFPRSASYDAVWMLENVMGPNPLWLAEALSQVMDLQPGMRVMDLGCGRATSSIFLAREFQLQVWATDLWIGASDNWKRICAANAQQRCSPFTQRRTRCPSPTASSMLSSASTPIITSGRMISILAIFPSLCDLAAPSASSCPGYSTN